MPLAAIAGGSGTSVSSGGTPTGSVENEIVGARGAFSALDEASKSGPLSPGGRADGGLEAMFESRFGFGGGASLRDIGGPESCVAPRRGASITALLASVAGNAAFGSVEPGAG